MATYSYDKPARVLTITLTAKEDRILTKSALANGPQVVKNMFDGWLLSQIDRFTEQDLLETKNRLMTATDAELAAVRLALGLP